MVPLHLRASREWERDPYPVFLKYYDRKRQKEFSE
jgi:hypothetical protein